MTKESVSVIIDIHEPPEITGAVDQHSDVEDYEFKELPSADLEVEGIGFERKTVEDYTSSIMDRRLKDQTRKLGQRYDHAYVLLDGDMSETESPFRSSMNGSSLRGHMASLTARENSGVHGVIPCSNPTLLADMAVRLARKHIEESDDEFIPQPIDDPDVSTTSMMYCCIDGVGPELAKKLEEYYPTVGEFVQDATYDSLQEIEGVGETRALRIIDGFA